MTLDTHELSRVRSPDTSKINFRDASTVSESVASISNEVPNDNRWPAAIDAKSIDSFEKRRSSSPGSVSMGSSVRYTPATQYYSANRGTNRLKITQGIKPSPINGTTDTALSPRTGREIDDKTRAFHQLCKDFDATELEIPELVKSTFSPSSGVSDDDIRRIMRVRVSSKQMEPEQQIAAANKVIKRLKETLTDLLRTKNEFIIKATTVEKNTRTGWANALETMQILDDDRYYYKKKLKQMEVDNNIWKDNAKDSMRELTSAEDKNQSMKKEIEDMRRKVQDYETAVTQTRIALEVEKTRVQELEKQYSRQEATPVNNATIETIKVQARKEVENELKEQLEKEKTTLRDDIRHCEARIRSLESQLSLSETQLARAVAETEAANAIAKSKDYDMMELMKSIKDIQNAGQTREESSNKLRREAEVKVTELEKSLAVVQGNINLLTHEKSTLKESLDTLKQERDDAVKELNDLKREYEELKNLFNSEKSQLNLEHELRLRSEQKEHEERSERIALSAQMMAMTKEYAQMESQLKDSNDILEAKWKVIVESQEEKVQSKDKELKIALEEQCALQIQIDELKQALQTEKNMALVEYAEEVSKLKGELLVLRERMKLDEEKVVANDLVHYQQIEALEAQVREGQAERRRLHNLIQELRGNVRVFARIRPFLPNDKDGDDQQQALHFKSETALKLISEDKQQYDFNFDRVFSPAIGQEAIFTEVSEFVQSALDGYNVCLFSYGQTGSGKTYTMQGFGTGQMRGIIPRAIEQVGNYKQQLEKDGWQYDMQVSFLEIYNESIRDLLREEGSELLKHDIKVDAEGRRFVSDLTMVPLEPTDKDAVEAVMRQAAKHRAVGSTDMNATSSRSHSVFTLHLTAFHPTQRQALRGTLNLVDLAGSERLSRSNASGDRAKETVAINKSLSALTDVFVAIGQKASHIPFRNSKLTYLLQPSLSGDGKTLMMVNLSPTEMSAQESLCSLRFAAQVNKCELGKAKRSLEDLDADDAASIVSEFSSRCKIKSSPGRSLSDVGCRSPLVSPRKPAVPTPKGKTMSAR